MFRLFAGAASLLVLGIAVASADEIKGTVKAVDKAKNTITVTAAGKDTTYTVGKDVSIVSVTNVPGKKGKTTEKLTPVENGLDGLKRGSSVTLLTEDDMVTSVKIVPAGNPAPAADVKKKKKKT